MYVLQESVADVRIAQLRVIDSPLLTKDLYPCQ